jgi:hypothetical protein
VPRLGSRAAGCCTAQWLEPIERGRQSG